MPTKIDNIEQILSRVIAICEVTLKHLTKNWHMYIQFEITVNIHNEK